MSSAESRARYWARSFAGFAEFSRVQPNAAHESLARLQRGGWISALLTQNVDRCDAGLAAAVFLAPYERHEALAHLRAI